jgi:hypothetical protein
MKTKVSLRYFHKDLAYSSLPKNVGWVLMNTVEGLVVKSVTFMKNTGRLAEKHYVYHF